MRLSAYAEKGDTTSFNAPQTKVFIENYKGENNFLQESDDIRTALFAIKKVCAPFSTISELYWSTSNKVFNAPKKVECRVVGNKMSITSKTIDTAKLAVLSFSPEATEIEWLPFIGIQTKDLKKIYIEGLPYFSTSVSVTSMFHSDLPTD
jgi:hypothetical protein